MIRDGRYPKLRSARLKSGKHAAASSARIFVYRLGSFSLGSLSGEGPRVVSRTAAIKLNRSPSDRSIDPLADADDILSAGAASSSGCLQRMAANQASRARSRLLFSSRHAWRSGLELFLLCRDPENERRYRDHRAVHGACLGVVLCGGARPAKALDEESACRSAGRYWNCAGHRHSRNKIEWRTSAAP